MTPDTERELLGVLKQIAARTGTVTGGGSGDMTKSAYDPDNDGVVTAAASAPWSGLTGVPSTFPPSTHTHTISDVTNLQTSLDAKATLASPALTGTPTAPTAAVDTNTTQIASTAYVIGQAASATPSNLGTAATGTSTRYARADHVHNLPSGLAPNGGTTGQVLKKNTNTDYDYSWQADATGGGGSSPGGGSGDIQYNNAGSFAGAANVEINGGNLQLMGTTTPAAPASGNLLVYAQSKAARVLPHIIGPSGIDTSLQVSLHANAVFLCSPSNGSSAPNVMGGALTTASSIGHVQTLASANRWQATRRTRFQTSTAAGNASGMRTPYTQWFFGNASGFGGFFFRAQLGMNINLDGGQKFLGLCNSTALLAGEPSALTNMCGMGYDSTDASTGNWFFMRNDGTGTATKVDLGASAARNTTHGYDLIMFAAPNSQTLNVLIINLDTNTTILNTNYTTDLPAVNTGLAMKADVRNGAQSASDGLEIAKLYIETDY